MIDAPDSRSHEDGVGETLARAVADDTRRYRRLLETYAALLTVPILAGVWIWITGVQQEQSVAKIKAATEDLTVAKLELQANTEEVREEMDALVRPLVPVEIAAQEPTPDPPAEGFFLAAFADPKNKSKLVGWNVKRSDGQALKSVSDLVNSKVKPLVVMVIRTREPTVEQITNLPALPSAIGFIKKEESVTVQEIKTVETKEMIQLWAKVAVPQRPVVLPDKKTFAVVVALAEPDFLVQQLKEKGYNPVTRGATKSPGRNQTILLGTDVPFEYAVEVLKVAKSSPELKFWDFGLSRDKREIYFGSLSRDGAAELSSGFFEQLDTVKSRSGLFDLKEKYKKSSKQ